MVYVQLNPSSPSPVQYVSLFYQIGFFQQFHQLQSVKHFLGKKKIRKSGISLLKNQEVIRNFLALKVTISYKIISKWPPSTPLSKEFSGVFTWNSRKNQELLKSGIIRKIRKCLTDCNWLISIGFFCASCNPTPCLFQNKISLPV